MSYFVFLDLSNSVGSKRRPKGGENFGDVFINELDIRLFGYSISERARAPIPRGKRTVEYLSIADGLTRIGFYTARRVSEVCC